MIRKLLFKQNIIKPKDFLKVFSSALIGTSAMTLYSYLRSGRGSKDFREPQLLNEMLNNLKVGLQKPTVAGWILHYKVGFGFATSYYHIWSNTIRPTILSGALLGAANGLIGIAAWETALHKHPHPPHIDRQAFYQHLFIAHMVFGSFTAIGYRMGEKIHYQLMN